MQVLRARGIAAVGLRVLWAMRRAVESLEADVKRCQDAVRVVLVRCGT